MAPNPFLAVLLLAGLLVASRAQQVTNECEANCPDTLNPICVRHYDTHCKPSWWGQLERCMSLKKSQLTRKVMPNGCKYACIRDQYCWEAWQVVGPAKLSEDCQQQWTDMGFAAAEECHKC